MVSSAMKKGEVYIGGADPVWGEREELVPPGCRGSRMVRAGFQLRAGKISGSYCILCVLCAGNHARGCALP